jgi:hypothetical protein
MVAAAGRGMAPARRRTVAPAQFPLRMRDADVRRFAIAVLPTRPVPVVSSKMN